MAKKGALEWIVYLLVIIGGVNWGLVGLFNFNLVETILGSAIGIIKIVYILVGLSALYVLYMFSKK